MIFCFGINWFIDAFVVANGHCSLYSAKLWSYSKGIRTGRLPSKDVCRIILKSYKRFVIGSVIVKYKVEDWWQRYFYRTPCKWFHCCTEEYLL